ncbi:MAG: beta-lactamase family protein [bacterium]|nr:beta-lactamase family protein [bacterium]
MKKQIVIVFIVIISLFLFVPSLSARATGAEDYAEQIKKIEHFVETNMETLKIPGLAVAFYKDGFTWSKGFGYSDLENKIPVTPRTRFRLASVTKPMTATAILKLAEDGKLKLDDEVQKYVPYFPKKRWPVTIRHLLGHLGGISHYREDPELHIKTHHNTRQAIAVFKDFDLEAEPGTKYRYTSYGYNLLGAVVEGASGQSFSQYMTENIWKPLGMTDTVMDIADDIIPNRTRGYRRIEGKVKNAEFIDISSRFAGGGTLSTVLDLLKFSRGLDKGKILSLETQKKMYVPMMTKDKRRTRYGMGWSPDYLSGYWNVSHGGGQAGTSTYLLRFPGENFSVAVASNLQGHYAGIHSTVITRAILGAFHIRVETPSEKEFDTFHFVWHIGLGYYSFHNKPYTDNAEELAEGFNYFNGIDAGDKDAQKKIADGIHESTGSPWFRVGSYMAHCLAKEYGTEKLDYYRKMGAIPFVSAYIDLYKKDSSIPAKYHFTEKLEKSAADWNRSWEKTWTDETRSFYLIPLTEIAGVKKRMKKIFKGRTVYPRLGDIAIFAGRLKLLWGVERGIEFLQTVTEIFPKNTGFYYTLGQYQMEKGDNHAALKTFKKAFSVEKKKEDAERRIAWAKDAIRVAKKPHVVSAGLLINYIGDYGPRHITYHEGNMYYKREGRKRYRLIPLSDDTFTPDGLVWFRIQFAKDKAGHITKIIGHYLDGRRDESLKKLIVNY